ncbi:hypothetical protein MMC27_004414 [Xylographa pallens]|nr:hypothetical protein [Xylographa pallens]
MAAMLLPTASSRLPVYIWLVLSALVEDVFGQGNYFIYPPTVGTPIANSLVFELGSTVNLSWSTAYPVESLYLWQDTVAESEILLNSVPTSTFGTQYTWTVATSLNLSASNTFHLCLYDLGPGAISLVNFNTVDFSISQSDSQLNDTSANPLVPTGNPTASSSSSSAAIPPPSTALPQSAVIGLGAGLGLSLPLLLAAGIFAGWRLRARATRTQPSAAFSWEDSIMGQPLSAASLGESTMRQPLRDEPQQPMMWEVYSPVEVHPCKLQPPSGSLYAGMSELEERCSPP